MKISHICRTFACTLALTAPTAGYSDDTDIIFSGLDPDAQALEPLVMLTLDLRPDNLDSVGCTVGADCLAVLGPRINAKLSELNSDWHLGLTSLTRFDVIRVALATLFDDLEGVKVGMMVNHHDDGAYVLRGFRSFKANDTNHAREELLRKMFSLPSPGGVASGGSGGSGTCTGSVSADKTMTAFGMTFTINDAVVAEGGNAVFTITGSGTNDQNSDKTLGVAIANGGAAGVDTATSGTDYTIPSMTGLTIQKNKAPFKTPSASTVTITVPTTGDTAAENTEGFKITLGMSGATDTAVGYGTICNLARGFSVDDPAPVVEGNPITFTVTRAGPTTTAATISYATVDGTAVSPTDFTAIPTTTLSFPAGMATRTVQLTTKVDADAVGPETFTLRLSNASAGNTILDADGTAAIKEPPPGCENGAANASQAHKYQGAELYFELFRYLTGGPVKYGHEGWNDFTGQSGKNLDQECYLPGLDGSDETPANLNLDPDGGIDAVLQWDTGGPKRDDPDNPHVEQNGNYVSPLGPDAQCAGTYAINLMFGASQQEGATDADANKSRAQHGTGTTAEGGIATVARRGSDYFSQFIQWFDTTDLAHASYPNWSSGAVPAGDQTLGTYILRLGGPAGQFSQYAEAGATVLDAENASAEQLLAQIKEIFNQILSVSASFVAASVPVNVFNRVEFSDDIFIALFNADEDQGPFWPGNLKKLKLGYNSAGNLIVYDALDSVNSAIAPGGRINYGALTYWTTAASLPDTDSVNDVNAGDEQRHKINGRDGPFASRGGAGHRIPGATLSMTSPNPGDPGVLNSENKRKVFTEADTGASLMALDMDDTTAGGLQTDLGAASVAEARQLICYARGLRNCASDGSVPTTREARKWILADALHSRPLPLNYGARNGFSRTNPDIRVLMGSNDGYLRMIQNTEAGASCGDTDANGQIGGSETACTESGKENWAFMPRMVLGINKAHRNGVVPLGSPLHPIGVDGEPVVMVDPGPDGATIDSTDGDTAWVFFGLRRGGAGYYGIDISDPDDPRLIWRIVPQTAGFEELALTFSTPTAATVMYGDEKKRVLVFGGGYYGDGGRTATSDSTPRKGYDNHATGTQPDLSGTDPKGNAIYIVDAETGHLIWKAVDNGSAGADGGTGVVHDTNTGLDDSIAAEIAVVDSNGDDIDDRAYVGDMGGNIWRIDLPRNLDPGDDADNRENWKMTKLAALGDLGNDGGSDDRRFMNRIDVVFARDPDTSPGSFDALLIGSGDREHPKQAARDDYLFVIKDPHGSTIPTSGARAAIEIGELADANCFLVTGAPDTGCDDAADLLDNGYKLALTEPGEKILAPTLTIGGQVYFSSYLPEGGPTEAAECNAMKLGIGRGYAVNLFNGRPVSNRNLLDDNGLVRPSTAADRYEDSAWGAGLPTEYQSLGGNFIMGRPGDFQNASVSSHYRTYWFEKDVDH